MLTARCLISTLFICAPAIAIAPRIRTGEYTSREDLTRTCDAMRWASNRLTSFARQHRLSLVRIKPGRLMRQAMIFGAMNRISRFAIEFPGQVARLKQDGEKHEINPVGGSQVPNGMARAVDGRVVKSAPSSRLFRIVRNNGMRYNMVRALEG